MASAPKKKPAPQPEFINQYGLKRAAVHTQLTYDMAAFGLRLPVDSGAPARPVLFKRIAEKILPGYFEFHDWTRQIIETGCHHTLISNMGCSNCVAGHTKIDNPVTGYPTSIQELCEGRIAPIVQTLDGPCQAGIPFLKGVAQLYEVVLENGNRFEATADHLVLASLSNASHYVRVGDLRISQRLPCAESCHHQRILTSGQSVRVSGALGSPRIAGGFPDHCCSDFRHDDEQLLLEANTSQSFFPSQGDAQKHSSGGFCEGVQANKLSHIRSHLPFPLSTREKYYHDKSMGILEPLLPGLGISSRFWRWSQLYEQFAPAEDRCLPYREQFYDCDYKHCSSSVQFVDQHLMNSFPVKVSHSAIVSIRKTSIEPFYDISVPGPQHYFAEGVIHHNSAKTHNWAGFAVLWWLCYPDQSSVTFVSTSIKSLRRRGWAQIQRLFTSVPGDRVGNFVDSRMMWQAVKGDDKHAIIGKAVEEGSVHKVADDIKGVHTKRQMVIVDEANSVSEAIWEAITNLYSYPKEFVLVALANPRDRLSKFSRFSEPLDGWTSVDVNTEEWEGKPQKEYGNIPVKIIRFDAEKSPNIIEGKIVSKHLPTKEKVEAAKASGGGETPSYWTNFRGFPPPEGLNKTVFSESALITNDAFGKFVFTGKGFLIIGILDPAFGGGDRPALRFSKCGMIDGEKWGIETRKPIILPLDPYSTNPIHFQLAEALRRQCEKVQWGDVVYSCPPENVGIDATGEGGGLCDIVQRTWSPKINRIEFGGRASDDSVSLEDVRPSSEVYENKTVEMHFRTRDALNAGQLKGIDPETSMELCNRQFDDSGKRIKLQKKKDYKEMFGKSPDFGDTLVMTVEVARRKGFRISAVGKTVARIKDWSEMFRSAQDVHATANYDAEEEGEYEYA